MAFNAKTASIIGGAAFGAYASDIIVYLLYLLLWSVFGGLLFVFM